MTFYNLVYYYDYYDVRTLLIKDVTPWNILSEGDSGTCWEDIKPNKAGPTTCVATWARAFLNVLSDLSYSNSSFYF